MSSFIRNPCVSQTGYQANSPIPGAYKLTELYVGSQHPFRNLAPTDADAHEAGPRPELSTLEGPHRNSWDTNEHQSNTLCAKNNNAKTLRFRKNPTRAQRTQGLVSLHIRDNLMMPHVSFPSCRLGARNDHQYKRSSLPEELKPPASGKLMQMQSTNERPSTAGPRMTSV